MVGNCRVPNCGSGVQKGMRHSFPPDDDMPPRETWKNGGRQTWKRLPDGNIILESKEEIKPKKSFLETASKTQSALSSELINVLQTQINLLPLAASKLLEIQSNKIKDQSSVHYTVTGTAVDNEGNPTFIIEANDSNSVVVNENNSTNANVPENAPESTKNVMIHANVLGQCAVCFEVIEKYDKEMKSMSDVEMRQIVEKNLGFTFTDCEMYPKFFCPLCAKVIKGFDEFRKDCQKKHRDYARYLETLDKIKIEQSESSNDMIAMETKSMVETDDNLSDSSLEDTAEEPVVKVELETVISEKRFRVCHLCGKDFNKTCRYCTASDLNQRQIEPGIAYKYSHITHCDLLFANLHNVSGKNKFEFYCQIVESYFDGDAYLCPVCGVSIPQPNHSTNEIKRNVFIDHLRLHKKNLKCALHDHKSKRRKICPSQENQDKLTVRRHQNSSSQLKT